MSFSRRELLAHGIILFLFTSLLITRSGPPSIPLLFTTYTADVLSYVVIWPVTAIAGMISLLCLVGVLCPTAVNWIIPLLEMHSRPRRLLLYFYGFLFMTAFYWNFAVSWTARLADAASRGWPIWPILFFGLAWLLAIVFALAWRKKDADDAVPRKGNMARQPVTRKCPNCGQRTVVNASASCQWCGWPLAARPAKETKQKRQGKTPLLVVAWRSAAFSVLLIVLLVVAAVGINHWDWTGFPQIFVRQWVTFLVLMATVVFTFVLVNLNYVWFTLGGLGLLGFFLLLAAGKASLLNTYIGGWLYQAWDMNLFSTAVTVFALAIAFGAIAIERTREKRS